MDLNLLALFALITRYLNFISFGIEAADSH